MYKIALIYRKNVDVFNNIMNVIGIDFIINVDNDFTCVYYNGDNRIFEMTELYANSINHKDVVGFGEFVEFVCGCNDISCTKFYTSERNLCLVINGKTFIVHHFGSINRDYIYNFRHKLLGTIVYTPLVDKLLVVKEVNKSIVCTVKDDDSIDFHFNKTGGLFEYGDSMIFPKRKFDWVTL